MARRLAHTLRSPLGVIDGGLSEIGTSPSAASDPMVARYVELGRRSVRQLVELSERLAWAGRVQLGAEEPAAVVPRHAVVVQWPEVIRRCVEARHAEWRERNQKARNQKQIDVSIDDAVGQGSACRDASERALAELLDNALLYARTTVRVAADVDGEFLRVRVADDGTGLPDGGADVFLPPQKLGSRVGFGLWLVERIATALQGSVGVERTGDEGTVMVLRIPVSAA
jgi:signal transduction histidine kinase